MKVLANDGIAQSGISALEKAGYEVILTTVAQNQLVEFINKNNITVLLVRSATKVSATIIEGCPSLKIIGRGGVGMDNIDVDYAREKGLKVINTPAASSHSVAELVFAHLYGMARFLHTSNREMPLEGDSRFKDLKKAFANGVELKGKTIGIIGMGRIGQATAKIALGNGMKVIAFDPNIDTVDLELEFYNGESINFSIDTISKREVLQQADFVTVHVPSQKEYIIGTEEFQLMKKGSMLINAARGGVIDEIALVKAIEDGILFHAALDVYENEPTPEIQLLMNPALSLSPHIGAATVEAQERIGSELAEQIITIFG